jgi:hypothetical protein
LLARLPDINRHDSRYVLALFALQKIRVVHFVVLSVPVVRYGLSVLAHRARHVLSVCCIARLL